MWRSGQSVRCSACGFTHRQNGRPMVPRRDGRAKREAEVPAAEVVGAIVGEDTENASRRSVR